MAFFEGDLQAGIALAIRESKMVASLLESQTVLIRIAAGSQEATFLSAFCPISKVPTLVAILNGRLLASLEAGITREQFVERLKRVLRPQLEPETAAPPTIRDPSPEAAATPASESPPTLALPAESPERPSQDVQSSAVQALLAERRLRLEAQKRAQDAAEKQERIAKAKARREAAEAEAARAPPGSAKARDASYAQQQKRKQLEAKLERDRIMKLVENDKAERKEREERRKASSMSAGKPPTALGPDAPTAQLPREKEFPIQIRLLDGSTIRTRFSLNATLRADVRSWIDRLRSDGDIPYTFKQVLTPFPNRAITISEEEESLQELGFPPSATLVLVPIHGYTDACQAGSSFISRSISTGYSLVSSGASTIATAFWSFLGTGSTAVPEDNDASSGRDMLGARGNRPDSNIRTLRHRDVDRDDKQLYNGNQLNFEPYKDEKYRDENYKEENYKED